MFAHPRRSKETNAVWTALLLCQAACVSNAQNFTTQIAGANPFGVNGVLPFGQALETVAGGGIKGGFSAGIGVNSIYDSNFFQSENNPESEVTLTLTPSLAYTTDPEGGARNLFAFSYLPVGSAYLENSDLNRFDQSVGGSFVITGSKTVISAYVGIIQQSGVDRFAGGGFVTGTSFSAGLRGSYQVAPRTLIYASISPSLVDYTGGSAVGFGGYYADLGASWAATERFSFGPALNYSSTDSDSAGTIDAWGISMVADYKATERIGISGTLGTQFFDGSRDTGSGQFNLTGSLNATYRINELWLWRNSIQSGLVPSPTQTNYVINNWSVISTLDRALTIGTLGFGLDMEFSDFEQVGAVNTSQGAEQNFAATVTFARPVFSDRLGFNSSLMYILNNGQTDWDQIQLSAGLNIAF